MKKDKKSFVLYADMVGVVSKLPDEKAGQLLKLILSHVNGEDYEVEDLMLDIAFEPIKAQLTRDAEKWENTCKARSEAGKKGGRPKKQVKAKKPIASFEKQSKAKKADNDNDSDSVTDTVNVNDNDNVMDEGCLRIAKIFTPQMRRTEYAHGEKTAWNKVKKTIKEHDYELIEWFYGLPKSKDFDNTWKRKQQSATLLNNLNEQLDLAYDMKEAESKKYALPKPKHATFK